MLNPRHSAKYVYHIGMSASSFARARNSCATERRRIWNLSSAPWISSRFSNYYIKKGRPHEHRYGKKPGNYEYFVANSLKKNCKKKNFLCIHDWFIRDEKFRKSMFGVGRSEELCREMDKLANEDHTHHITPEKIVCTATIGGSVRSQLVTIRCQVGIDLISIKQALSTSQQLKHQEDTAHQQRWKSYSSSWWNWQESWWHSCYEHHHEDEPSPDWSGKYVEKWLGYFLELWLSEFTWCIITVQTSLIVNRSLLSPTGV